MKHKNPTEYNRLTLVKGITLFHYYIFHLHNILGSTSVSASKRCFKGKTAHAEVEH